MNRWNIPDELEKAVRARDKVCIYCQTAFSNSERKLSATWEHIINDETIISFENIALCCFSCNASKGAKPLNVWLQSQYCSQKGISIEKISDIAKNALKEN